MYKWPSFAIHFKAVVLHCGWRQMTQTKLQRVCCWKGYLHNGLCEVFPSIRYHYSHLCRCFSLFQEHFKVLDYIFHLKVYLRHLKKWVYVRFSVLALHYIVVGAEFNFLNFVAARIDIACMYIYRWIEIRYVSALSSSHFPKVYFSPEANVQLLPSPQVLTQPRSTCCRFLSFF